jgi:hypothetical protein
VGIMNKLAFLAGSAATLSLAAALSLGACLVAPDEPNGSGTGALTCPPGQRTFNGACRAACQHTTDCPNALQCMTVAEGDSLCLDYKNCSFLGDDTTCTQTGAGPTYSSYYGYETPGAYGGAACAGNATYQSANAGADDPRCGESHAVKRCKPVGYGCALVPGTSVDIAEP